MKVKFYRMGYGWRASLRQGVVGGGGLVSPSEGVRVEVYRLGYGLPASLLA